MKKLLSAVALALACALSAVPAFAQVSIGYQETVSGRVVNKPVTPTNPLPVSATVSAETATTSTAAAPTYVEGATDSPLSTDLAGSLRVLCTSGCSGGTQYAEDAAHASGNTGTLALGVRKDTASSLAGTDGDNTSFIFDSTGRLWTHDPVLEALLTTIDASLNDIETASEDTTTYVPVNVGLGGAALAANNGTASATTLRVTVASDSTGALVSKGGEAVDAALATNPVVAGCRASSAAPTAVSADNDVQAIRCDLNGNLIARQAPLENSVSGVITSAMTATTSTSLVAAPGASLRNYITEISCVNAHATVDTLVNIQDGSGGTVIAQITAPADFGGHQKVFPHPLRQPTANTALFVANVTTGASVTCSASGFKAP